jgi:hypothetical protein
MEHKLRDFLRKVSNRNKTEHTQNAETSLSTRRERNSLPPRPPRPLSSQTPGLKPSPAKQSLDISSPPANWNSEPVKLSVEQNPESLAQSYEHPRQRVSLLDAAGREPGLPSQPVHSNIEPTSLRSPTRSMATSSNAAAKGRTEGRAGTTDTQNNKDSFPVSTNNDHSKGLEESVAHDYAAYQPMLSPTSVHKESQQTTFGGDTSLIMDTSQQRHNEDITNRNTLANNSDQSGLNVESPSSLNSHNSTHNNLPSRIARDEPHYGKRKGKTDDNNVSQANSTRDFSERNAARKPNSKLMDLRAAIMDGANDDRKAARPDDRLAIDVKERLHAKGINIDNTVDVDKTTTVAPGAFSSGLMSVRILT